MTIETLTSFFLYCSLINFGMLLFSFAVYSLFRKPISKMHAKIYGLKEEEIPAMVYKLMAFYKVLIIVFCFVPYLALLIIGR